VCAQVLRLAADSTHVAVSSGELLVVDDTVLNLDLMERILTPAGYEVTRANNGIEALSLARRKAFDAILMDIEMPGLDGWALCRFLKADARTAAVPLVFVTAQGAGDEQVLRALAMGGADYVSKPVNGEILVRRVGVLVRAYRAEAEQRRLAEERAAALNALATAQVQALEARKLAGLSTMARGLAHEINNPLAAAMSDVSFALSESDEEQRREALVAAMASLDRVRVIVQRMRRLGEEIETKAPVPVDEVVLAAVSPLVSDLERGGVHVKLDLDPTQPLEGAGGLAPVAVELVTNAARAMPGGGEIDVRVSSGPEFVELSVEDRGCGMDSDTRQHVFDPFYTSKKEWRAIGLGLPMCHTIVTNLRGTIDLDSVPGRGTVVTVRLPIARAA
jgi:signal transduction histidine kinase